MAIFLGIWLVAAGLTLVAIGRRVLRVEGGPRCRRCGYDLRGHPDAIGLCPECGAMLVLPDAISRATTVRRPRIVASGAALILVGIAGAALDVAGLLNERTLDRMTPTSFVLWSASHGTPGARGDAIERAVSRSREQPDRLNAGQRRRLVALLVDAHGDPKVAWQRGWNGPTDAAIDNGSMPDEQRRRYLEQMIAQDVHVTLQREVLRPGEPIVLGYDHRLARVAAPNDAVPGVAAGWFARDVRIAAWVGGASIPVSRQPAEGFAIASVFATEMARQRPLGRTDRMPAGLPIDAGAQTLRVDLTFDLVNGVDLDRGVIGRVTRRFDLPVTYEPTPAVQKQTE